MQWVNIFSSLFLWFRDMCEPLRNACHTQFSKAVMAMNVKCEFLPLFRKYHKSLFCSMSLYPHTLMCKNVYEKSQKRKRIKDLRNQQKSRRPSNNGVGSNSPSFLSKVHWEPNTGFKDFFLRNLEHLTVSPVANSTSENIPQVVNIRK